MSSLLLFSVLVAQSITINLKYLYELTVAVHESMKCYTIEHDFTFFLCVIYNQKGEVSSFQLIQHFVYRILCNMLNKSYLVCGVCEIFSDFKILLFVAKHSYRVNKVQHKMIYGQESFYRSHIFSYNNCKQDLDLFLLMVLYCKDQHAPLYP